MSINTALGQAADIFEREDKIEKTLVDDVKKAVKDNVEDINYYDKMFQYLTLEQLMETSKDLKDRAGTIDKLVEIRTIKLKCEDLRAALN